MAAASLAVAEWTVDGWSSASLPPVLLLLLLLGGNAMCLDTSMCVKRVVPRVKVGVESDSEKEFAGGCNFYLTGYNVVR